MPLEEEADRFRILESQFPKITEDLKRVGVTRMRLWEEYRLEEPEGYSYSQFCEHFRRWQKEKQVVMILDHKPGEETMMDFAGKKLSYVDWDTGEGISCEVFVAECRFGQHWLHPTEIYSVALGASLPGRSSGL